MDSAEVDSAEEDRADDDSAELEELLLLKSDANAAETRSVDPVAAAVDAVLAVAVSGITRRMVSISESSM